MFFEINQNVASNIFAKQLLQQKSVLRMQILSLENTSMDSEYRMYPEPKQLYLQFISPFFHKCDIERKFESGEQNADFHSRSVL